MESACESESCQERHDISNWEERIWEGSPPIVSTDESREDVRDEREERPTDPDSEWGLSTREIDEILREDESEDDEERERYDISLAKLELSTDESDWSEMLRCLFEEWRYREEEYHRRHNSRDCHVSPDQIDDEEDSCERDYMDYCDFLQENSGKSRSEECQSHYEYEEEGKEPEEYTHLKPRVLPIWRCKYIRQSYTHSSEEETYCEAHPVPCVRQHIRHAIPPEIDWEECHPEREEGEEEIRQRRRIKTEIGILFLFL